VLPGIDSVKEGRRLFRQGAGVEAREVVLHQVGGDVVRVALVQQPVPLLLSELLAEILLSTLILGHEMAAVGRYMRQSYGLS